MPVMNPVEGAVVEMVAFLEERQIDYVLVGGVAVTLWEFTRATVDADFNIALASSEWGQTINQLCALFRVLQPDPHGFVKRTRVLPLYTSSGFRIDVMFAVTPGEREIISRAVIKMVAGRPVRTATVEDLIWTKLFSERVKDYEDARTLLRLHRERLDVPYLEAKVIELAEGLAMPEALATFRQLVGKR